MTRQYTCDRCRGTFDAAWSEEEALAERRANFPDFQDFGVLCEDCYELFWQWAATHAPELKRRA